MKTDSLERKVQQLEDRSRKRDEVIVELSQELVKPVPVELGVSSPILI